MSYLPFKSCYEKFPRINVHGHNDEFYDGYASIVKELKNSIMDKKVLTIETYPGVRYEEIVENLIKPLKPSKIIFSEDAVIEASKMRKKLDRNITEDRVFGVMSVNNFREFFMEEKIQQLKNEIENTEGLVVVYGVGATYISKGDVLVYADLARWQIQKRYRTGELANWNDNNYDEDKLRKYKRGYFIEWRMADRLKKSLYKNIDYLLDTNIKDQSKMVTGKAFLDGLKQASSKPFRMVPYFDPGVWGGQWMKEVCNLDPKEKNYAWSFDGVPEENSVYLQYGDKYMEVPAINIVFCDPKELLGDRVHARFGTEFPIRFDFLDTMEGQNLSLQVHPLTEYAQENFGIHYTQDESYYILDAKEDGSVFLGVKEGIDPENMIKDLKRAQAGEIVFPTMEYVNKLPAKKHDHFLIPAGTVHCSGSNTMILEISATPYIFTFKLWDWGRVDLDGKPRPINIERGSKVIQFDRDTKWVNKNIVNRFEDITENEDYREERTGLHEREFIETRRFTIKNEVAINCHNSVNMLNLIEGEEAIIESLDKSFESLIVHYAETFIIPEICKEYRIRPFGKSEGKEIMVMQAYVRT